MKKEKSPSLCGMHTLRKCSVGFGAIWTHDRFNNNTILINVLSLHKRQLLAHCGNRWVSL